LVELDVIWAINNFCPEIPGTFLSSIFELGAYFVDSAFILVIGG
jgi:hypothetical protein